jgi:RimJ/RimL family protein N-acetyltransferase
MSTQVTLSGTIRKLLPSEMEKFRDHLLRLDKASRRMRFAHAVSDGFIADYASRMTANGAIVYAYLDGDNVCAVAELRKIGDTWGHQAEAAFSVETAYQEKGIATELLGRVIRSARNRGVSHLIMSCLADNAKMQAVARHHDADLSFEAGEVIADIVPLNASPFSVFSEAVEDRVGYLMTVFDLKQPQTRQVKAA